VENALRSILCADCPRKFGAVEEVEAEVEDKGGGIEALIRWDLSCEL